MCGLTFLRLELDKLALNSDRKRVVVALSWGSASEEKHTKTHNDHFCLKTEGT